MAVVVFSEAFFEDIRRFARHLREHDGEDVEARLSQIVAALDVLHHSPCIGRPVRGGRRELVIGERSRGYVALYQYAEAVDTVVILTIRSQRESGYPQGH